MNITEIPFNKLIGIKNSDNEDFILMLDKSGKYLNHLETIHASAQFALAEATSGEYLLRRFSDFSNNTIPVVRRVEIKFSKPANGVLYSKAEINASDYDRVITELNVKGRTLLQVKVFVQDQLGNISMQSTFEWFMQKIKD